MSLWKEAEEEKKGRKEATCVKDKNDFYFEGKKRKRSAILVLREKVPLVIQPSLDVVSTQTCPSSFFFPPADKERGSLLSPSRSCFLPFFFLLLSLPPFPALFDRLHPMEVAPPLFITTRTVNKHSIFSPPFSRGLFLFRLPVCFLCHSDFALQKSEPPEEPGEQKLERKSDRFDHIIQIMPYVYKSASRCCPVS